MKNSRCQYLCRRLILGVFVFAGCAAEEPADVPEYTGEPAKQEVADSARVDSGQQASSELDSFEPMADEPQMTRVEEVVAPQVQFSPRGRYLLQVGAYKNQRSAERDVVLLQERGYPAQMVPSNGVYRVRIGFFKTVSDAETLGRLLKQELGLESWVDNR